MNNTFNDLLRLQKQLEPLRQYQHLTKTLNPISPSLAQNLRLMELIQKMTPIYEQVAQLNNISGIANMTRIGFLEKLQRLQTNALGDTLAVTALSSAKNMTYWHNLQKYFPAYQRSLLKDSSKPPSPKHGNFIDNVQKLEANNHEELVEKAQDLVASTITEISQVLKDVNINDTFLQETNDHFDSIAKVIQQDLTNLHPSSNDSSLSETTFSVNVLATYQEIQELLCNKLTCNDMLALLSFAGFFLTVETATLSSEKILFFRSIGLMLLSGYIALRFIKPKGKDN